MHRPPDTARRPHQALGDVGRLECCAFYLALRGSPWFTGERLPQCRQAIECGGWQRTFFNRDERILELVRRCYTDQDGPNRRLRDRKPRSGLCQARGESFLYYWH
jgi:hypothetical protein